MRSVPRRHLLGLIGAAMLPAAPARRRLPPKDESAGDAAFAKFLATLRAVARERNEAGLRALCAPDVITGIDSPPGPAELVKKMRSGGWAALETVLTLGVARYDDGYAMPYLFGKFPEDLDDFEYLVAVRPQAVLRASPAPGAAVMCPLDYDIVRSPGGEPRNGWRQVERLDGCKGWAAPGDLRSGGAERLITGKIAGSWKITAWAAGD